MGIFMSHPKAILFFGFLFVTLSVVRAELILDTTANKSAPLALPSSSSSLATGPKGWSFTLAGGPWTITNVSWGLYGNIAGTADIGVRLYSGTSASGVPLEDSGTNNYSLNTIGSALYYDWSGLSWSLFAGTYTVAAYNPGGGTVTARLATTTDTMVTGTGVSSIGPTQTGNNYAVLVQGTSGAAAVPEPGTWAAAILLTAGAAWVGCRRRLNPAEASDQV